MSPKARKRKTLLVNRPYQLKVVLKMVAVVITATLSSTLAVYILTAREVERSFFMIHRGITDMRALLIPVLTISGLATFLALAALAAYTILRETHRVVGPAERMERKFQEMSRGDFALMQSFRKDDVLKGLDDCINLHLNNMADYFTCLERALEEVKADLAALESGPDAAGEKLKRIGERVHDIEKYAASFRRR